MWQRMKHFFRQWETLNKQKALEDLEWEARELQHLFALMTLGQFIGMPAPPLPVALELLPDMEQEFAIMLAKINAAHAPLSDQFSKLDAV
ncbi:MAG: hypothetical protein D6677_05040 [Calditrichaeota bacterium]|nr:MAG: hypothetical protein D6677_05040 [Calditrichota bacterium]